MGAPEVKRLLRDEHFSVDATLLQAWTSHASLERVDGQQGPPPPPSSPGEGISQPKEGKKRSKGDFRGINLGDRPVTDGSAESCNIHLAKEIPKSGIGRWTSEFQSQRLGQHAVMAEGKTLQVPQALAAAYGAQHRRIRASGITLR